MTDRSPESSLTVSQIGEFGLISRLARVLVPSGRDPLQPESSGPMGIGDDAAMWQPRPGYREVLTTDALVENVHFRHSTTGWRDLGWKALAENVSDIAAMGARPTQAFVTIGIRGDTLVSNLEALYQGFQDLNDALSAQGNPGVTIAGGDTVSSPITLLSVTVVGEVTGDGLRRAAGRAGDLLAVTGTLGGSAGGLTLLEAGDADLNHRDVAELVSMHRRPMPRVGEGLLLAEMGVGCGMDLSDGLLGDAGKLAYASGLYAVLEYQQMPVAAALVRQYGEQRARAMALTGGEDYELLVAGPPDLIAVASRRLAERDMAPLTVVGRLEAGQSGQVTVIDNRGAPMPTPRSSWDHFRQSGSAS